MAGLSAAHEPAERGFDVTVYEQRGASAGGLAQPGPADQDLDVATALADDAVSGHVSGEAAGRAR